MPNCDFNAFSQCNCADCRRFEESCREEKHKQILENQSTCSCGKPSDKVFASQAVCSPCEEKMREQEKEYDNRREFEKHVEKRRKHIEYISRIPSEELVPIAEAVHKYRTQLSLGYSDVRIKQTLIKSYSFLDIQKIQGRWKVSKNKLEKVDFNLFNIGHYYF